MFMVVFYLTTISLAVSITAIAIVKVFFNTGTDDLSYLLKKSY